MKRRLVDVLFELRNDFGAKVYRMDNNNVLIQTGNEELRDMAVWLLECRCSGVRTVKAEGFKIIIIKEE